MHSRVSNNVILVYIVVFFALSKPASSFTSFPPNLTDEEVKPPAAFTKLHYWIKFIWLGAFFFLLKKNQSSDVFLHSRSVAADLTSSDCLLSSVKFASRWGCVSCLYFSSTFDRSQEKADINGQDATVCLHSDYTNSYLLWVYFVGRGSCG